METPFKITVNKEILEKTDNYFEPLNITEKRAHELMDFIVDAMAGDTKDQVELFEAITPQAQTVEELVFIAFKAGEYTGMLEQRHEPERGNDLAEALAIRYMKKRLQSLARDN